ncbi:MAG TPA: Pr6Pr family membrane protein [Microbacteriaceae bacterium]|nr:Pr6Pr family membrane protein [Microbacteriaceae bacterium]
MRILFALLRLVFGIAIITAIVAQLAASTQFWTSIGIANLSGVYTNFFSFFTIDSNVLAAVVLLIGAGILAVKKGADPSWFNVLRACAVTYMVVTGIVYNLLLRGLPLPQGVTVEWSNEVLHAIGPAYLLIDWLFAPGRQALPMRRIWAVLAFPIVWVVYTMVRGPLADDAVQKRSYWYPYPFLNPHNSNEGYATVAFYIVLIAAVIGLVAAGVIWISRHWYPWYPVAAAVNSAAADQPSSVSAARR